ncbi:MAG: hypothetical protein JKY84_07995, partial [Emcibacteraceae bacterium]|nr:hypothetical protein [Emcibacteraceae bacterium]
MTIKFQHHYLKTGLICAAAAGIWSSSLYAQSSMQDLMPEAQEQPKSILFPAGVPGPYFPSNDEIARAAQKQLENKPDTPQIISENNGGSLDEIVDIVELDDGDNSAYGTMLQNNGGLAKTIWQPSTYEKIEALLKALNLPSKSPAMDEIS